MKLKEWGFKVSEHTQTCKSADEVFAYLNRWDTARHELGFDIDGAVIKVNNLEDQEILEEWMLQPIIQQLLLSHM